MKATIAKRPDAIIALRRALDLSAKRISTDPKARNLLKNVSDDPRFNTLRQTPEFRQFTQHLQLTVIVGSESGPGARPMEEE